MAQPVILDPTGWQTLRTKIDHAESIRFNCPQDVINFAQQVNLSQSKAVLNFIGSTDAIHLERFNFLNCEITKILSNELKPNIRLITFGSAAEYGITEASLVDESTKLAPISEYGKAKASLTHYLRDSETNSRVILIRPFNLIGPDKGSKTLASQLKDKIQKAIQTQQICVITDPSMRRDFVDIRDITRAIDLLLETPSQFTEVNICSNQSISIQDFIEKIVKSIPEVIQPTIQYEISPNPNPVRSIHGSLKKIQELTQWTPDYSIEQSIQFWLTPELLTSS